MSFVFFLNKQMREIQRGGITEFNRKCSLLSEFFLTYVVGIVPVIMMRLLKPLILIRIGELGSSRIGNFAGRTELYLCELAAGFNNPKQKHIDLFYMEDKISNLQMASMWKRTITVLPRYSLIFIHGLNKKIPGWEAFEAIANSDRDFHNLLDKLPPHLKFTPEEEFKGQDILKKMGIPEGASFVCLNVRDNAYLQTLRGPDFSYHSYRDCNIQNYILAAEELGNMGFYVIRMGAAVKEKMASSHPKIIDYATNGMRSDFMDIYLGAKCFFCISTSTGWDCVPYIFRRPTAYTNIPSLGGVCTFRARDISILKHHWSFKKNRNLAVKEIVDVGADYLSRSDEYEAREIRLIENTPEEIRDLVVEMAQRLKGSWQTRSEDEDLQRKFWLKFPSKKLDKWKRPNHGELKSRVGAAFLRDHQDLLD